MPYARVNPILSAVMSRMQCIVCVRACVWARARARVVLRTIVRPASLVCVCVCLCVPVRLCFSCVCGGLFPTVVVTPGLKNIASLVSVCVCSVCARVWSCGRLSGQLLWCVCVCLCVPVRLCFSCVCGGLFPAVVVTTGLKNIASLVSVCVCSVCKSRFSCVYTFSLSLFLSGVASQKVGYDRFLV